MKHFVWTKARERAAKLVADDRLTNEQIAADVGVSRRTLDNWKTWPEFQERVAQIVERTRKAILSRGIAVKANRVGSLHDRWERLQRVIEERAGDALVADVPGGTTGLLVPEPMLLKVQGEMGEDGRFIATGESQIVYKYAVDTGVLKELRDIEKQAAQELGQWTEKVQHSGDEDAPIAFTLRLSNDGDVRVHPSTSIPEAE